MEEKTGYGHPPPFIGIFLCSFSTLCFEITLTRVFSISLWYHFAFMVISIGMLGVGLSGTVLSLYPGLRRRERLGGYALLLGLSIPAGYLLSNLVPFDPERLAWDRVQLLYILAYYVLLSAPFFFFGLVVSTALSVASRRSGLVYGADLLGAGAGALTAVFIMGMVGPERTVFIVSLAALAGAVVMGSRYRPLAAAVIVLAFLAIFPDFAQVRMSPYKGLPVALKYPGAKHMRTYESGFSRVDAFQSPLARFAPGLSLKYLEELPPQIGLSVDGSNLTAITKADAGPPEFLRFLPSALPYEIRPRNSVLIMDPKGGLNILLARKYSVERIHRMEFNPLIVDVIRKDFSEFSGQIYGEGTWTGLVRSRLMRTRDMYDVMDISLAKTVPSAAFGMAEDYRYTVEAFREYLEHLGPGGVLSISLFILPPPKTELRLLATAVRALEDMGVRNVRKSIAAVRSWGSICILVKPAPFDAKEIERLRGFARRNGFDLVYYPGIKKEETNIYTRMPTPAYYEAFENIMNPETREDFIGRYVFDIREVSDDRPFFHYHLKAGNFRETYELAGRKWQYFIEEGLLLPAVLIQALLASLALLFLPALRGKGHSPGPRGLLLYFAFLGLGFMFIEVPLIQKMILPLEHPSYAVAGVLTSVLVSSGAGSLLSERFPALGSKFMVAVLAVLIVPYGLLINTAAESLLFFPLPVRFALAFALILPAGMMMGIPFPLGMRTLGDSAPALIPWAWAANGCFSVLGPVLAAMAAMWVGFQAVFLIGAACYAGAFVVLKLST